jgi:hypothetical protein
MCSGRRAARDAEKGTGAILFGPVIAYRIAAGQTGGKSDVRARHGTVGMAGGAGNSDRQAVRTNGRHATGVRSRCSRFGVPRWRREPDAPARMVEKKPLPGSRMAETPRGDSACGERRGTTKPPRCRVGLQCPARSMAAVRQVMIRVTSPERKVELRAA